MQSVLDFYARPAAMTSAGRHGTLFDELPGSVEEIAAMLPGLVIHEHMSQAYGYDLPDERRTSVHLRRVEALLERMLADDGEPLSVARPPEKRLAGNCRHFSVLLAATLRARGIPARARCGFGNYFGSGSHEDHWVGEYWNAQERRWVLVDAQIDDVLRGFLPIDFDTTDVPRDRFVIAGDAWVACRAGEADPSRFGFSMLGQGGLWWIAGNLIRDVAALNAVEMLPWDVWGAMPAADEPIDDDRLELFDRLAALTRSPDAGFTELHAVYQDDERIRIPDTVHNAILGRDETV
ncbi:transglutaminase domain-containing protein [Phytoactinopolyspora alkaliphila]|uniref:Transglutaminase domain-containing protein n=2 Tax=Phytoactinopolyspora alkaliphila TaxID=1783498 RepID=A0A6N9YNK8_9ACTN|nr:transglutaminase domain-containing protein [Phytoactinopolyspora alkaliphila]